MELFAAVQPLVMTRESYSLVFGEDDPEEILLMQLQDRELAQQISQVLHDLYFMEADFSEPSEAEGLAEEVGTTEELHELRRIAAAVNGKTPDQYHEGEVPPGYPFNHLINHSDSDGYYLPVPFAQAFFLEETSIGSSVVLLEELDALQAPLLALFPEQMQQAIATADHQERAPIGGPVGVWHSLRRLCRSSVELNLPLQFG